MTDQVLQEKLNRIRITDSKDNGSPESIVSVLLRSNDRSQRVYIVNLKRFNRAYEKNLARSKSVLKKILLEDKK